MDDFSKLMSSITGAMVGDRIQELRAFLIKAGFYALRI